MASDQPCKNSLDGALFVSLACVSLVLGVFFACAHPLAPQAVLLLFLGFIAFFLWRPDAGLLALPVFLPVLNFSPWTGWLIVDEFDLLMLAVVASGYFQLRHAGSRLIRIHGRVLFIVVVALLVAFWMKYQEGQALSWFSGYTSSMNALRVGKSLLWVALLFPLGMQMVRHSSPNRAVAGFFSACLLGSCAVVSGALWERAFYPGVLDISTAYRTVAWFWEMHLGGAALDAYLALIAPLLVWAWRITVCLPGRLAIGAFVLAFVYVVLTTYSRGVIGAVAGSVVMLGALLAWQHVKRGQHTRFFSPASLLVLFLVMLEVVLVLCTDSFISKRLAESERDFGGRVQHWTRGIGLLNTPEEWLFGIGLGRLPARLTQGEGGLALSGDFSWHDVAGVRSMEISGPNGTTNDQALGGLYTLSQRITLISGAPYRFAMDIRNAQMVEMLVNVCEQHLLYSANCQVRQFELHPNGWRHWEGELSGNGFDVPPWQGMGHGVFSLWVLTPGAKVDVTNVHLSAGEGNLLRNGAFQEKGAGWFPVAHSYFLPWHIDNLYLEIMIETGVVGLLLFLAGVFLVIRRLFLAYLRGQVLPAYFISCIASLMVLGLVVSVLDMPRVATLFGLFLSCAWTMNAHQRVSGRCAL